MATRAKIFLSIVFTVLILADFIGNILVCPVVHRTKSMQTPMNYLITNVAITDIVIAIFAFPRHAINHAFSHPIGETGKYLCKFVTGGGFIWVSNSTCGVILITIAFERFFAVVYPTKSNLRVTMQKIKYLVPIYWSYALLVTTPTVWVQEYNTESDFCMENFHSNTSPQAYVRFLFTINFIIPITSMSMLYACVVTTLWRKGNRAVETSQAARYKARKKVTRMLVFVTSLHLICWTPNFATYLLVHVAPEATSAYGSVWYNITVLLILFNSAANPFCYCVFMKNFRNGILKIASWWREQDRVEISQSQRGISGYYTSSGTNVRTEQTIHFTLNHLS